MVPPSFAYEQERYMSTSIRFGLFFLISTIAYAIGGAEVVIPGLIGSGIGTLTGRMLCDHLQLDYIPSN